MKLETLYKRAKTGAIQYYDIMVEPEATMAFGDPRDHHVIRKVSGQLGTTSPIIHTELISLGKNIGRASETTPREQAESQAQSDWRRKKDEGYKSLVDLELFETKGDAGNMVWSTGQGTYWHDLEAALQARLPQFNTDASGNVKPMLSPSKPIKFDEPKSYAKLKWPQLAEPKFDGVRSTLIIDPYTASVQFISRSGKPYDTMGHLTKQVEDWLVNHIDVEMLDKVILDGEIYKHGWELEEINEAVKKYRPGITEELEFWVYDTPLQSADQITRSKIAQDIVETMNIKGILPVLGKLVENIDEAKEFHDLQVEDGFEGAMLKDPKGVYEQGCRSNFWRKVKVFDDTEFRIVGHVLGQRGVEDLNFICESPGGTFEVRVGGSRAAKQRIYNEYVVPGKHIDRQYTVKHFGYTKYNKPNLPTGKAFRYD